MNSVMMKLDFRLKKYCKPIQKTIINDMLKNEIKAQSILKVLTVQNCLDLKFIFCFTLKSAIS